MQEFVRCDRNKKQSGRIVVVPADILTGHLSNKSHNPKASLINQNALHIFFYVNQKVKAITQNTRGISWFESLSRNKRVRKFITN